MDVPRAGSARTLSGVRSGDFSPKARREQGEERENGEVSLMNEATAQRSGSLPKPPHLRPLSPQSRGEGSGLGISADVIDAAMHVVEDPVEQDQMDGFNEAHVPP